MAAGSLQQLLSQSVTQTLGLSDVLRTREREAVQLGETLRGISAREAQAQQQIAQVQAAGILGTAQIQAGGQLGAVQTREAGRLGAVQTRAAGQVAGAQAIAGGITQGLRLFESAQERQLKQADKVQQRIAEVSSFQQKQREFGIKQNRQVADLRKEFGADPIIKSTKEINQSLSRLSTVFEDFRERKPESNIAVDQALVIVFNKMLDPGSVVRESEFARTPQGAALTNRFIGKMQQFTKGGVGLTDADREELFTTAKNLGIGQRKEADKIISFFNDESKILGIDPDRITGAFKVEESDLEKQFPDMTEEERQALKAAGLL